jgi:hypothetical protein
MSMIIATTLAKAIIKAAHRRSNGFMAMKM